MLADPEQIDRISASTEYDAADPNVEIFGACVPDAMFGRKSGQSHSHSLAVSLIGLSADSILALDHG